MKACIWVVGYMAGLWFLLAAGITYGPAGWIVAACFIGAIVEVLDGAFNG